MRDYLRSLPVFTGAIATFDVDSVPDNPRELFARWLCEAADAGVLEPHAMTLSTCDAAGLPDARVLILKDLDDRGWWFASNSHSATGIQLNTAPVAALTFYWPQVGRQVRVRGAVRTGTATESANDFLVRGTGARAVALASLESQPLANRFACTQAVAEARRRVTVEPDLVASGWCSYVLAAETVEFWNADSDRQHVRLQYRRDEERWVRGLLWP